MDKTGMQNKKKIHVLRKWLYIDSNHGSKLLQMNEGWAKQGTWNERGDSWNEMWREEEEQGSEMKTVMDRKGQANIGKTAEEMFRESSKHPGKQRSWP